MAKKSLTNTMILQAYWIREFRKRKYPSAKKAAEGFKASPSQWTNWENASNGLFPSTLVRLADYLGVAVEDFSKEPENWDTEKVNFLTALRKRANKNKDRYAQPDALPPADKQPQTGGDMDKTDIFLEIASLINKARKRVKKGTLSKEVYDTNMEFLADLIDLASSKA